MKIQSALSLLAWLALTPPAWTAAPLTTPLGTSFTYQGRLDNTYDPNETVNLSFKLWTHPTSVNAMLYQVGSGYTASVPGNNANRIIWTDLVDFGAAPFTGNASYLEIYISPHNQPGVAVGNYVKQTPRIRLAPAPNATYAVTPATGCPTVGRCNTSALVIRTPVLPEIPMAMVRTTRSNSRPG